jgi:RNA polymerase sigma factor (TIGR02999 family)
VRAEDASGGESGYDAAGAAGSTGILGHGRPPSDYNELIDLRERRHAPACTRHLAQVAVESRHEKSANAVSPMQSTGTSHQITELLAAAGSGQRDAWDKLTPLIYQELKKIAEAAMRRERQGHTLQPTALVNEAYLRLVEQQQSNWNNRAHFYGAAAVTMRRVLVQHVRRRRAAKRGGDRASEPLDNIVVAFEQRSTDLLALDSALQRLAEIDPQQSRIVELRFFGGLSVKETAAVLGISESTVERGWRVARAWLLGEVKEEEG